MMRRSFAIFFLVVYTLVVVRPAFPFVNYLVNKDFIAKNLCENRNKPKMNCNGKCHLMKEIKKAGGEQWPVNNPSQKNTSEENSRHIGGTFDYSFLTEDDETAYTSRVHHFTCSCFAKGVFHPPSSLC